jgi:hypothetical protein
MVVVSFEDEATHRSAAKRLLTQSSKLSLDNHTRCNTRILADLNNLARRQQIGINYYLAINICASAVFFN